MVILITVVFLDCGRSADGVSSSEAILGSSIPSAKLEQEAQMFGFRDKALPFWIIRSPQQMQTIGFIDATEVARGIKSSRPLRHGLRKTKRMSLPKLRNTTP